MKLVIFGLTVSSSWGNGAQRGEPVEYLPPEGLGGFDLVLSRVRRYA